MKYRRFGRTEINMPLVSCGGMRFQTSWNREDKVTTKSIDNLEKIVEYALDCGINHFETARGYGTSEEEFGYVLKGIKRSDIILQSKCGPAEKLDDFKRNFEDSMNTLGVDYLDLFAVHGINTAEVQKQCLQSDLLEYLRQLKSQGVIRNLGFSTHAPTKQILSTIETGFFDYVNLWYSYIFQWNKPAIEAARKQDMGVFIISPTDKGGHLHSPPEKLSRLTEPLTPMAFNDLFILSHPDIHTISCGAAKPSDFDEHVQAIERMEELESVVEETAERLDNELKKLVSSDWASNFRSGVADFEETESGVNLPIMLWLWNLVKAFDLTEYAKSRYNLMGNAGHWFSGVKPEVFPEIPEEELREEVKNSPFRDVIPKILHEVHDLLAGEEVKRLGKH